MVDATGSGVLRSERATAWCVPLDVPFGVSTRPDTGAGRRRSTPFERVRASGVVFVLRGESQVRCRSGVMQGGPRAKIPATWCLRIAMLTCDCDRRVLKHTGRRRSNFRA